MAEKKPKLSHIDAKGRAKMVDVTAKPVTSREAIARGEVLMRPETLKLIATGSVPKGDVFSVAKIAGIQAAKRTSDFIPLCHPIEITGISLEFSIDEKRSAVTIESKVRTRSRTGVEMEALTSVSAAALAIYDMCKAVDKGMTLERIRLVRKSGGRSGLFERKE